MSVTRFTRPSLVSLLFFFMAFSLPEINCINLDDNPISADYKGDYALNVNFDELPETLSIFTEYTLTCASTGADSFFQITVAADSPGVLYETYIQPSAPLQLYFNKPYQGRITVTGIRPNLLKDHYSNDITIVNPFTIQCDSAALFTGDTLSFSIVNTLEHTVTDTNLLAHWTIGEAKTSLPAANRFALPCIRPDSFTISCTLCDTSDNCANLASLPLLLPEKQFPEVSVAEDSVTVPIGHPFTFIASVKFTDSLVWRIASRGYDTVTTAASLTTRWTDTLNDTIFVTAKNRFGAIGNCETLFVYTETTELDLDLIAFPTIAPVREFTTWKVAVSKNGELLPDSLITYVWNVNPQSVTDTLVIDNGNLSLIPQDLADYFTISVHALFEGTILQERSATVNVISDRPKVSLVYSDKAIDEKDSAHFLISARDANQDGSVAMVYFRPDKYSDPLLLDNNDFSWFFATPGTKSVAFWCIDNDGFTSDTLFTDVTVSSHHPWFTFDTKDTLHYPRLPITLAAPANPGVTGGSVVTWLWDTDGDGDIDLQTLTDSLTTLFSTANTINMLVSCVDNRNDSASLPMKYRIIIDKGLPVATSIAGTRTSFYTGDTAIFNVASSDPDGTIDSIHVLLNHSSVIASVNFLPSRQTADTSITLPLHRVGTFHLSMIAFDNSGNVSNERSLSDSITVISGTPQVQITLPEAAWINDTLSFILSGSDPDGSIASYAVKWDEAASWESISETVIHHRWTSPGVKQIRVVAIDNKGNVSDTITAQLDVQNGSPLPPVVKFIEPVWVYDTITFSITGTDPNGTLTRTGLKLDTDTSFSIINYNQLHETFFNDTGMHYIQFFSIDDDNLTSDTVSTAINVQSGKPSFASITGTTANSIQYIQDTVTFNVAAFDPNGSPVSLSISKIGSNITGDTTLSFSDEKTSFVSRLSDEDLGQLVFKLRVSDVDGFTRDTSIGIFVRKGTPVIDECAPSSVWVNDSNTISVLSHDTNGTITKTLTDWNRDGVWDDSTANGQFTHAWDTTFGGKTVYFTVAAVDDDGIVSSSVTCSLMVKMGRPAVSHSSHTRPDSIQWIAGNGSEMDTCFYVYRGGKTFVAVSASDLNSDGRIVSYNWDLDNNGSFDTITSSPLIGYLFTNEPHTVAVMVRDDDSLYSQKYSFVVVPDDLPPTTTTSTTSQPGLPNFRIAWRGLDTEDDSLTQFAILMDVSPTGAFQDTVLSFTSANKATIGKNGNWLTYTFNPQDFGFTSDFYFKVIARDLRGSSPGSINWSSVMYPY